MARDVAADTVIAKKLAVENIFAKLEIRGIRFIYIYLGLTEDQNRVYHFQGVGILSFIEKVSADVCIMNS